MSGGAGNRGEVEIEEPSPAQRAIARRAAESRATIPHLELSAEVQITAKTPDGWPRTAAIVRAAALALREHPIANGAYRDGRFERYARVNIGVAVPTRDAFALPALFDADTKSTQQLGEELERAAARARAGELTPPELAGTTFSLGDLGSYGIAAGAPLIVPGHAAALTAGAIRNAAAGPVMTITLACDHRLLYGERAAMFLAAIAGRLEQADLD